jgi:Family of unknown function (DUF6941)
VRLDWVIPCRYAELAGDGTMSVLGAGLDTFWVPEEQLPAPLGIFIATRVAGGEDEWLTPHAFAVRLVSPDLAQEDLLEIELGMDEMPPLKQPGHEAGTLLPLLMQWEANDFGLYSFDLLLDGNREKSVPVNVRRQSELEEAQQT